MLVHKCRKAKALQDAKALKRKMRENKINHNNTTTNIHVEEQKINDEEDEGEDS